MRFDDEAGKDQVRTGQGSEGEQSDALDDKPAVLAGMVEGHATPMVLMDQVGDGASLWEFPPSTLVIEPSTGRPRLTLALADDTQTRLANKIVTEHHYLKAPVDVRCSILTYLILLGGQRIGILIFGRPEATKTGDWFGGVADKVSGKCRYSRWEILNLARIFIDTIAQEGGAWYSPDLLPGFYDRKGKWQSSLVTTAVEMALECVVIDYLIAYPPVDTAEPYQLQEILSYCDTSKHKGTVYQQSGFRLERERKGLHTYARPVRPLTQGEDAYIRYLAEYSPRSRHYRAQRAGTNWHQKQLLLLS